MKEQIEQLRKEFNDKLDQLEKQIKPTIEVGKVYLIEYHDCTLRVFITEKKWEGRYNYYGFFNDTFKIDYCDVDNDEKIKELTTGEWLAALTKHADELYKGVNKVDRSGLDLYLPFVGEIKSLDKELSKRNDFDRRGFYYNGCYVMDKHGNWAKPVKEEEKDMFVNLYDNSNLLHKLSIPFYSEKEAKNQETRYKILGTYKLVKVD